MNSSEIQSAVITVTLLVLLLIAALVITFFVYARHRAKEQIEIAEARLKFEKDLRNLEAELTESMLTYFARELHDNVGQLLTALHLQIENQKLDHPQMAENFAPAESSIGEISRQLRLLSRTLNNDFIGDSGLLNALKLEIERVNALKRIVVHYKFTDENSNLERNQELMLFRIFQEVAQNALRHARAANLYVKLYNTDGGFRLEVRDDGIGFDVDQVAAGSKSSGLRNIRKRAQLAGLDLIIESAHGKGSLFVIEKKNNLG